MPGTTADAHLGLIAADGVTEIQLVIRAVTDEKGQRLPASFKETLTATVEDSPLGTWLESSPQEDWRRGVGLDYNMAPGVTTRIPGYAVAAGAATSLTSTIPAIGNTATPFVAIEELGSDVFIGQEGNGATGGRVLRSVGGTFTGGGALANSLLLAAGRRLRDLVSFGGYLYAVSDNGNLGQGELHRWDGAAWSLGSSDVTFNNAYFLTARYRTVKVNWNPSGTPATVLLSIDGARTIAYTKPASSPMLESSWITGVETGTGFSLTDLAAARKHAWIGARDGLFDMDEQGNSPNLMGYEVHALSAGIPFPVHYLNNYVYVSLGYQLDRVYVGENGMLQQEPGHCAPGLDTAAENEYRGYVTAMFSDQGWLGACVYNPITTKTGIYFGKDRASLKIDSPNPMIWHGPEIHSIAGYRVTKAKPSGVAGDLKLIIGSLGPASAATLDWVSLPALGSPLADLISNGAHKFMTGLAGTSPWQRSSQLHSLSDSGGDKAAYKTIYQDTYGTRGLPVTGVAPVGTDPYLEVSTRADPAPGSTAWGIASRVDHGPTQTVTPAVVTGGFLTEWRVDFFNPSGSAATPIVGLLDAMRVERWRSVTTFRVLHLDVEYGDQVALLSGAVDDTLSTDQITELLKAVAAVGRTTLRFPDDSRYTVKLRQIHDADVVVETGGTYGRTATARLQVALLEKIS